MDKNTIRLLAQVRVVSLSDATKINESSEICQKLQEILSQKDSKTLITYTPFADEVDISAVTNWCRAQGWAVTVMSQDMTDTRMPEKGIIIVPGRAFTVDGKRIGRGGGFYDTLLANHPDLHSVGVCFGCQIFEKLPQDSWDQRVDEVVFAGNALE